MIPAAYTQPPRPAGRGKQLQNSPVHQAADALGIPVRYPETLRDMRRATINEAGNDRSAIPDGLSLQMISEPPKVSAS